VWVVEATLAPGKRNARRQAYEFTSTRIPGRPWVRRNGMRRATCGDISKGSPLMFQKRQLRFCGARSPMTSTPACTSLDAVSSPGLGKLLQDTSGALSGQFTSRRMQWQHGCHASEFVVGWFCRGVVVVGGTQSRIEAGCWWINFRYGLSRATAWQYLWLRLLKVGTLRLACVMFACLAVCQSAHADNIARFDPTNRPTQANAAPPEAIDRHGVQTVKSAVAMMLSIAVAGDRIVRCRRAAAMSCFRMTTEIMAPDANAHERDADVGRFRDAYGGLGRWAYGRHPSHHRWRLELEQAA